jgi:glutathione synthase/RimK-type ligase-like ATP-grasp enzyme
VSTVALAGCVELVDPDLERLIGALAALGVEAVGAAWNDATVAWDEFDATVLRSTWGYDQSLDAFLAWARDVPRLINGIDVVTWNCDKRYLAELDAAGVAVIPTVQATSGELAELPDGAVVVKPAVGGGSRGVALFGADQHDLARAHVDRLGSAGQVALIQPVVASLQEVGETDVVVIDGQISHAVAKRVVVGATAATSPSGAVSAEACEPDAAQRAIAAAALRVVPVDGPLCYARVDTAATPDGPVVVELELIEPFLFLETNVDAAERFAVAIARHVAL